MIVGELAAEVKTPEALACALINSSLSFDSWVREL